MTVKEFKTAAGADALQFRPCFNNKKVQRCTTPIGVLFMGEDYNPKSKVQDVETKFDESGNQVFWLTNVPVSSVL